MKVIKINIDSQGELTPFIEEQMGFLLDPKIRDAISTSISLNTHKEDIVGIKNFFKSETLEKDCYFLIPELTEVRIKATVLNNTTYVIEETGLMDMQLEVKDIKKFMFDFYYLIHNVSDKNKEAVKNYLIKQNAFLNWNKDNTIMSLIREMATTGYHETAIIFEKQEIIDKYIKHKDFYVNSIATFRQKPKKIVGGRILNRETYESLRKNSIIYKNALKDKYKLLALLHKEFKDIEKNNSFIFLIFYEFMLNHQNTYISDNTFGGVIRDTRDFVSYYSNGNDSNSYANKILEKYNVDKKEEIFKTISAEEYLQFKELKKKYSICKDVYLDCSVY